MNRMTTAKRAVVVGAGIAAAALARATPKQLGILNKVQAKIDTTAGRAGQIASSLVGMPAPKPKVAPPKGGKTAAKSTKKGGSVNVTVNNPARQRASESLQTGLKKVAYKNGWQQ